ncbi:hypothetical protein JOD82_001722 [Paenibacillus sp. 1182]|uniref:TadE/TadG family type IV pilus assembly protein n=1 Tax=Paenibacillus sp. 1182 TaxID=2806565 RepID=UPI001AE84122|nr:cobalt ABC transporter permease [Paenibacillus sp. 1182]MBP1308702.1 hypothetical protein [Paenibacillus sp. 1182]
MFKRLKKIRDEKGFVSVLVIFAVSFILPFFIFHMIEMTYLYGMKDKFQNFNDAAASAGAMQIEKTAASNGDLKFKEDEVKHVVNRILSENYGLDANLNPQENSYITGVPIVKVSIVNQENDLPKEFSTPEGFKFEIKHPTVIVYTEVKPKGIFFNKFITIKSISALEVSFKTGEQTELTNNPQPAKDGLIFTLNKVVNPLYFPKYTKLMPMKWSWTNMPMAAGGNIEFSLINTNTHVQLKAASYELKLKADDYERVLLGSLTPSSDSELTGYITLPEDAPIGTTVTVDFKKSNIILSDLSGEETNGNRALGFSEGGAILGEIDANVFGLICFTKVYPK